MNVVLNLSLVDAKHLVDVYHLNKQDRKTVKKAKKVLEKIAKQVEDSFKWLEHEINITNELVGGD